METVQAIKQRFEIIGNDPKLNRAIEKAIQVAPTDISVMVTGESGVGKENIPRIIHSLSHRKHGKYIAVNCGAIPEGTIDSELFGHEKGAFTGATSTREGYFEVADGGTIFLDEVGELPLTTQVRLLRVLENGEFIKVGSSQVQKTNVRIVAATNVNLFNAIEKGKFREDLYYRLTTVEITLPPLRERNDDIHLLFRKFVADFAHKYKMPPLKLDDDAVQLLQKFRWNGNIRQLRNVAEQISVLETNRDISSATLQSYLPTEGSSLPSVINDSKKESDFSTERDILYKVLFDMKSDLNDLKKLTLELMKNGTKVQDINPNLIQKIYGSQENESEIDFEEEPRTAVMTPTPREDNYQMQDDNYLFAETIEEEEVLRLEQKEIEMIKKSLEKNKGKRKAAADELGISERTLYRKIKQFDL
ncbi:MULTISPECIES: sigma-54-dependent Fis family transcriptional regulator [Flavobacterium]|jgi:transcriptional regulator with PAS, ATPase and Fis domain|uniref:Sigma-54-dependent Fis family transcriptional regulator n=1 Tax=Flavobacterium tructae TaxID=1114873 RepID=A0A1S1J4W7_9FLAO|nr:MULTISPECIES: sigma-54 dependent transcriptional regulator [Flavobacterium]MDL2144941.1 sigma-54 dependent transcriptional regulator [Flavobacterium tructae]OHT43333.1 sigma-54-dependent Fis family transcriptional regulator [Flavobacterium tructae]OXB19787.1 sigma-54-dependent Fis family transcriptional regulator [Flavobacterium tructae]OXB22723.1 sigma-54-dependent Fis family transcriptional regulator [Flavobacterium tructae]URC14529.1 sigma-54 dependent transcriptional regulator [Flavobac